MKKLTAVFLALCCAAGTATGVSAEEIPAQGTQEIQKAFTETTAYAHYDESDANLQQEEADGWWWETEEEPYTYDAPYYPEEPWDEPDKPATTETEEPYPDDTEDTEDTYESWIPEFDGWNAGYDKVELDVYVYSPSDAAGISVYRDGVLIKCEVTAEEEYFYGTLVRIVDSSVKPDTDYTYEIRVKRPDGREFSFTNVIHTDYALQEPTMLAPECTSTSITLNATLDERYKVDGYVVERKKGSKWTRLEDENYLFWGSGSNDKYDVRTANYTDRDLKPSTKYTYRIRFYQLTDSGKKEFFATVKCTASTLMAAPEASLASTAKKAKLSWSKVKGAEGYEVYVYSEKPGTYQPDYWGWGYYYGYDNGYDRNYVSSTSYYIDESLFKKLKTIKSAKTTSASFDLKGNRVYVYRVRAYKGKGKNRVYSEFSTQVTTDSTKSMLNGLTMKSRVSVGDYDLKLVKNAVAKCVKKGMSNWEKAVAVYDYVHNAAIYEYDYNQISLDPIEAILAKGRGQCYQFAATYQAMMKYIGFDMKLIGGKTASGGPHWWNELVIDGKSYMFDPQVGGRFCITYESMGDRRVTKEKTVD